MDIDVFDRQTCACTCTGSEVQSIRGLTALSASEPNRTGAPTCRKSNAREGARPTSSCTTCPIETPVQLRRDVDHACCSRCCSRWERCCRSRSRMMSPARHVAVCVARRPPHRRRCKSRPSRHRRWSCPRWTLPADAAPPAAAADRSDTAAGGLRAGTGRSGTRRSGTGRPGTGRSGTRGSGARGSGAGSSRHLRPSADPVLGGKLELDQIVEEPARRTSTRSKRRESTVTSR